MATHSRTLAWKIPWMEEPGRLQSMGLLGVEHDWATSLSLFTFMHWRRKWQPTPVFLPGECREGGAWWAAVYGVSQSRTRLKWLSSRDNSSRAQTCFYPCYGTKYVSKAMWGPPSQPIYQVNKPRERKSSQLRPIKLWDTIKCWLF